MTKVDEENGAEGAPKNQIGVNVHKDPPYIQRMYGCIRILGIGTTRPKGEKTIAQIDGEFSVHPYQTCLRRFMGRVELRAHLGI